MGRRLVSGPASWIATWRAGRRQAEQRERERHARATAYRRREADRRARSSEADACPSCGSIEGYTDGPPCMTCHYEEGP